MGSRTPPRCTERTVAYGAGCLLDRGHSGMHRSRVTGPDGETVWRAWGTTDRARDDGLVAVERR